MTRTCCNCDAAADWEVNDPGANPLDYCVNCLPRHMRVRADSGHFKRLNEPEPEPVAEAPKPRRRKAASREEG